MCPHPLLHLAVRAAFAVQVGRRVTRHRQVGVEGAGGQWAVEEVLVRAQVVALGGGGAGQAEVRVVGATSSSSAAAAAHPGADLLSAQQPHLHQTQRLAARDQSCFSSGAEASNFDKVAN